MTTVLIRCDASLAIGSGHVMRCRTLARRLRQNGAIVSFICRSQPGDLIFLLEQEFSVIVLPELPLPFTPSNDLKPLMGRQLYQHWLGCDQADDAIDCLNALKQVHYNCPDWLIVDHYGLDIFWETKLVSGLADSSLKPKVFVIDDLADRPHQADLLLDQNFFGDLTDTRYLSLVPEHCHQLLGPKFALLSPEYPLLHHSVPPRTELRRVLVFFGGVDSDNLSSIALDVLSETSLSHLCVDVVLGLHSPHRSEIEQLSKLRPNTTLHASLPSLAGLISRADISIGAVGATTWERSCLGLSSIGIPCADNQLQVACSLSEHNFIQFVAHDSKCIREQLLQSIRLYDDSEYLYDSSLRCKSLTTGQGTQHCSSFLLSPSNPPQTNY